MDGYQFAAAVVQIAIVVAFFVAVSRLGRLVQLGQETVTELRSLRDELGRGRAVAPPPGPTEGPSDAGTTGHA